MLGLPNDHRPEPERHLLPAPPANAPKTISKVRSTARNQGTRRLRLESPDQIHREPAVVGGQGGMGTIVGLQYGKVGVEQVIAHQTSFGVLAQAVPPDHRKVEEHPRREGFALHEGGQETLGLEGALC